MLLNPTRTHVLSSALVLVNFGKDYVYFGQKLVAEPTTSHEPLRGGLKSPDQNCF
jgi:hypothetical protein